MLGIRSRGAWITQVVAWFLIISISAVLVVAVLVPRLVGATPYTVLTGSMRPSLPPGTLAVVKPVDQSDIVAGDVITYQLESGRPTVVTHRVVTVGHRLDGTRSLTTQGDANSIPDAEPVRPVQLKGRVWYAVPYLGYVNDALTGDQRQMATYGVAAVLALYAAHMLSSPIRDRRAGRLSTPKEATTS